MPIVSLEHLQHHNYDHIMAEASPGVRKFAHLFTTVSVNAGKCDRSFGLPCALEARHCIVDYSRMPVKFIGYN